MNGIRYTTIEEVYPKPWLIQGTIYTNIRDAKMAAMKLFSSLQNDGVIVKRVADGWTLLWWRQK